MEISPHVRWALGFFLVLYKTSLLIAKCVYMRILFLLDPSARERDLEAVTATYSLPVEGVEKYLGWRNFRTVSKFFYTSNMVLDYFVTLLQDLNKTAVLHGAAPDPTVVDAATGKEVKLVKLISARFTDMATFATVYTQEAHPTEGGDYIDYFLPIDEHKSLAARLEAAGELAKLEDLPGPLLVDNMNNEASKWYGSFPDRIYVVLDGVIVYQGGVGPHGYHPHQVEEWLSNFSKTS